MASPAESSYFPSLNKCLNGDEILISWKTVFSVIQETIGGSTTPEPIVERFLSDATIRGLLTRPFDDSKATPQTKSLFETKTSAINVTPSSDARFDIGQVKADTLWLSNVGGFDEISALRIVVQECQARVSVKLLGKFSEEELASLREAAGDSKFSSPITAILQSRGVDPVEAQAQFETGDNRRQRILALYLSERRYFLKCLERILFAVLNKNAKIEGQNGKGKQAAVAHTWLEASGRDILAAVGPTESFFLRCLISIERNVQNINNGSGWYDGTRPDIESDWIRTQLTEATHTMEILLQMIFSDAEFPTSQLTLGWFRLLQSCQFFNAFSTEESSLQTLVPSLQSLTIVISLAVLNVAAALQYLNDPNQSPVITANGDPSGPFILNTTTLSEIHEIMMNAADMGFATAGPPILAWVSFLKIIRSEDTDQGEGEGDASATPNPYADLMESVKKSMEGDDAIDYLARRSVNESLVLETLSNLSLRLGNTYDALFCTEVGAIMRIIILDLIGSSNSGLGYIPEVIGALLSTLLGGQNYWDDVDSKQTIAAFDPIASFITNDVLITFFQTALSRYPCEPLPFLRLIHAVASCGATYHGEDYKSAVEWLNEIPFFTYRLPEDFIDYETAQEEDNSNTIRLKVPVHLFQGRSKGYHQRIQSNSMALTLADPDFCIKEGVYGRVISDSGPRVVFWYHKYSGLKYFGKLLETFLTASDLVDATTGMPVDRDSVVEIIDILATILHNTTTSGALNPNAKEDAQHVLETASSGLSRNHDIITVVFDIFEEELQRQSTVSGTEVPLGILIGCVHFIHSLIPLSPGRVWPLLARSGLLGVSRGGGRLSTIVEGVELVSGRYEFLLSCIRLYEALVDDVACNAIRRRSGPQAAGRFQSQEDVGTGLPDHILSKVLLFFTRYLIDVLESSFVWKFNAQNDRRDLSKGIATAFDKTLRYVYGIEGTSKKLTKEEEEEEKNKEKYAIELASKMNSKKKSHSQSAKELSSKITGVLIASASQIVESFLATSSSSVRFQPILVSFLDGLDTPDLTNFANELKLWTSQTTSVLAFSTTLLRVSNSLHKPPTELEHQIFKSAPLIARLYAVSDLYKRHVLSLFEALVVTANNVSEPPSLLGHLGPHTAKNFLHILSDLDKPLVINDNNASIWHFLSMVVSNKQQWFANYLLTGKTPRESVAKDQAGKIPSALDKPLLTTALEKLMAIETLPQVEALAMLEFVSLSQNFWPWTVYGSSKHGEFIAAISDHVGMLKPIPIKPNLEQSIVAFYQSRIAAYIAEILAMHLFHSRQTRSSTSSNNLIANLAYYIRFGTAVPSLNSSLHRRLAQNFATRHPNCTIQDLKRTTLEERQLGKDYFYDLSLAEKMLQFHPGWNRTKNDGLRVEFELANVNLSLVDAQIALFHGWKVLALELTSSLASDIELQKAFIKVSLDSLSANSDSHLSEEIFTRLCYQRADFALILTQGLIEAKCKLPQIKDLLTKTWETIRNFRGKFERSLRKEDAPYYRSLLKLLFVAARAHNIDPIQEISEDLSVSVRMKESTPVVLTVLEIIKYIVALGLREFATEIHDEDSDPLPEDVALINGILQSCLRIPGVDFSQTKIVSIFKEHGTARVATTLFSWSDSIAIDGDPIYGELSILFLLELSTLPMMAEQLAIDGILGQLASANISSYLRSGKVSPFAEGPGLQRCYSIWTRGILPLVLNLLDAVQISIAAEVALFLNQFQPLLSQCSTALEAPESSRTTSSLLRETKYICVAQCSEAHSLSLIHYILEGFRQQSVGGVEIPVVKWDAETVAGNADWWLGARTVLRERIVPMGRRDEELAGRKVEKTSLGLGGAGGSLLEEMVVAELGGIRDCVGGGDDG